MNESNSKLVNGEEQGSDEALQNNHSQLVDKAGGYPSNLQLNFFFSNKFFYSAKTHTQPSLSLFFFNMSMN